MKAIVLAGTSEIGSKLIQKLIDKGYSNIFATYYSREPSLKSPLVRWHKFKIQDYQDNDFLSAAALYCSDWDLFVSCVGTQHPVGRFDSVDIARWIEGININSTYQVATLLKLMEHRSTSNRPCAVFFAGGGTNSATPNYSSQTLGKISLIKATELLSSEFLDTTFFTLGPGWVKANIHSATLEAGPVLAGDNFYKTQIMLETPDLINTSDKVVKDLLTLVSAEHTLTNGRNFSSVHDDISSERLQYLFGKDNDFYRLRRACNNA